MASYRLVLCCALICAAFTQVAHAQQADAGSRQFHVPEKSETFRYVAPPVDAGLPLEVETMRKRIVALEESNEELRGHVSTLTEAFNEFLKLYSGEAQGAKK